MRFRLLSLLVPALALAPPLGAAPPAASWAKPEIVFVTSKGFLGGSAKTFRPDAALTQAELAELVAQLQERPTAVPASPQAPVTLAVFDSHVVRALGLSSSAARFASAARTAGLAPPTRFGTEVVTRLLGLRTNHPAAQDALEPLPGDPISRAEAAFTVARILDLSQAAREAVKTASAEFELPALTESQQLVLRTAVSFIGYPYVWGGEFETTDSPFGEQAQGGFDCSGFVWRVFKLQTYSTLPLLRTTLRGRTTMAMSGEVPVAQRVPFATFGPSDLLFFGARGTKSKPAEVDHMAIALGNGWFIHSSSFGVALSPITTWYTQRFAWARSLLTEAGL